MALPPRNFFDDPAAGIMLHAATQSIFGRAAAVFTILFNCRQEFQSTEARLLRVLLAELSFRHCAAPDRQGSPGEVAATLTRSSGTGQTGADMER
jgi:hypothetical protein